MANLKLLTDVLHVHVHDWLVNLYNKMALATIAYEEWVAYIKIWVPVWIDPKGTMKKSGKANNKVYKTRGEGTE